MKKQSLWAVALMLCSLLFLSSCAQDDNFLSPEENISVSDFAISDPEIRKEIEFMKSKGIIDEDLYQQWLKAKRSDVLDEWDVHIDEAGTVRHDGAYRITPPSDIQSSPGSMTMIDDRQIDRRLIQDLMKESELSVSNRMRRWKYMYGSSGGTITLRVFTQNGGGRDAVNSDWKTALNTAVSKWNNQGLKLQFNIVNATNTNIVGGYVNVYMKNLSNNSRYAQVAMPGTPGYFGEKLEINTHKSSPQADINGKVTVLVHELGHIVGFDHTDEFPDNINTFNTAITCDESWLGNSFMYGASAYNQVFTDFSTCDKQNLQYYWGYGLVLS